MIIHDVKQRTEEWDILRLGKFGASSIGDLFSKKTTLTYQKLILKIAFERKCRKKPEGEFKNDWMQRGIDMESEAISAYELLTFSKVRSIGYVEHDQYVGCSPDGFVGKDGLIQVKCPAFNTHMNYKLKGVMPLDYLEQVQMEMWVCGKKWNDFFSYHPDLNPFLIRVYRDEKIISEIESKIKEANNEIELILKQL